jgi:hypothetical protein
MILGAEIGLLVFGIYSMVTGKYSLGKGRTVEGSKARILGGICLLPFPLALAVGIVLGLFSAILGISIPLWLSGVVEIIILIIIVIAISVLGKKYYNEQESAKLEAPTI